MKSYKGLIRAHKGNFNMTILHMYSEVEDKNNISILMSNCTI